MLASESLTTLVRGRERERARARDNWEVKTINELNKTMKQFTTHSHDPTDIVETQARDAVAKC